MKISPKDNSSVFSELRSYVSPLCSFGAEFWELHVFKMNFERMYYIA